MTSKHIAITTTDGRVHIMEFLLEVRMPGAGPLVREATEENVAAEIRKARLDVVSWRFVGVDEMPDRTFRDAWTDNGRAISVQMEKARAIHMGRIRAARAAVLSVLDVEFSRALGQKNDAVVAEVEAKRQTLRDIPQTFDLTKADSPEALKALWPEILGEKP